MDLFRLWYAWCRWLIRIRCTILPIRWRWVFRLCYSMYMDVLVQKSVLRCHRLRIETVAVITCFTSATTNMGSDKTVLCSTMNKNASHWAWIGSMFFLGTPFRLRSSYVFCWLGQSNAFRIQWAPVRKILWFVLFGRCSVSSSNRVVYCLPLKRYIPSITSYSQSPLFGYLRGFAFLKAVQAVHRPT